VSVAMLGGEPVRIDSLSPGDSFRRLVVRVGEEFGLPPEEVMLLDGLQPLTADRKKLGQILGRRRLLTLTLVRQRRRILLVAGCKGVPATLWDLESKATLDLGFFFQHLKRGYGLRGRDTKDWPSIVCFAGEQRLIVGFGNCAYAWDLGSVELPLAFVGHTNLITAMVVLGSSHLLTGSNDCSARLWDHLSGEEICVLEGHTRAVTSVFGVHEHSLVTGSLDCTVRVWDTCSGKLRRVFRHGDCVASVFAAAGDLVTGCHDGNAYVRNIDTGRFRVQGVDFEYGRFPHCTRDGRLCVVESVCLAGQRLVTGADDGVARLWDIGRGTVLRMFVNFAQPITSVCVFGHRLVTGQGCSVQVWDLDSGDVLSQDFPPAHAALTSVCAAATYADIQSLF